MIIPAIDLIDGNIVRLYQGDYQQQTNFNLNPLTQLQSYQEQGAKWLHLVDLTGAKDPTKCQTKLLCYLANNLSVNIQVGGGIRTKEQITKLLTSGINRVVIGSLAVKSPELVATWLTEFGSQAICLALDVNINKQNEKIVAISGWQQGGGKSLESIVDYFTPYGLQHALVTDISRDGTMQGANTQLYTELALEYPQINWQASGGIASLDDIYAVKQSKANAIIIGKALLTNQFSVSDAITAWHKS